MSSFIVPGSMVAIRKSAESTSGRYALNGVLVETKGADCAMVATDGRRLVVVETVLDEPPARDVYGIIPSRAADNIAREKPVSIQIDEPAARPAGYAPQWHVTTIDKRAEQQTAVVNCIEGRFPKWRDVLPDTSAAPIWSVKLDVKLLESLCQQLKQLTTDDSSAVTLSQYSPSGPVSIRVDSPTDRIKTAHAVLMPLACE